MAQILTMTSGTTSFAENRQESQGENKDCFLFRHFDAMLFIAHWPKEMILEDSSFVQVDSSQFVRWLMKTGNSHCMYIIMLEWLAHIFS